MCGPSLDPGLRPGAWHLVAERCFPCAYGEPESPTSPPTRPRTGARHGSMTIGTARCASLEFVCVFGQDAMGSRTRSGDPTGTLCIFGFPPRFSGHIVILLSCSFSDHCPRNRGAEEIGRMSVSSFAHPASISGIATSRTLDPQQVTAPRVGGRHAGGSGCCHRWRGSPLAGRKAPSVHRRWQRCGVVR